MAARSAAEAPGRGCPIGYRYGAAALSAPASLRADTLWIAGGLYGNAEALQRLLELYEAEQGDKALVCNGDFHWFDAEPACFSTINRLVLGHVALRGNVETELADPAEGAGCGCAYPEFVGDKVVEHSNQIIERLRKVARNFSTELQRLKALPMYLVAEVGGERVGIVHGDAQSLAGWGFSQEVLACAPGRAAAQESLAAANVRVFASSHSCLPVLQSFADGRIVVNNGAAGMPNFRATRYGVATRISVRPAGGALYGARAGRLHVEARPIDYDHAAWQRRFLALWPPGSDAHQSYHRRIAGGPDYELPLARRAA
ncbi:MAG: metallophosphoesterase family protein [Betaproteobacteria bacterium]|nr:metallophosphoesterase family protein [Betaproteobacteria bacterium]